MVEVFTSQGCINCPPSDLVMGALAARVRELDPGVVVLGFHTPFFDTEAWQDPYGTLAWRKRFRRYTRALRPEREYLPWMVLNGRREMAAKTSLEALREEIDRNRLPEVADLGLEARWVPAASGAEGRGESAPEIEVRASIRLREPVEAERLALYLAIYQERVRTSIPRGDNAGLNLADGFVVRSYGEALLLPPAPGVEHRRSTRWALGRGWEPGTLGVALVLQDPETQRTFQGLRGRIEGEVPREGPAPRDEPAPPPE